jgi:ClpP class serine protease
MAEANLSLKEVTQLFAQLMEQQAEQQKVMLQTVVSEIRKPPIDPIKEAQKKREHETKVKALAEMWEKKAAKRKNCAHSRQDGTCVIAWAEQSDKQWRGYCPNCDNTFSPEDADYLEQRRRPRGLMESVRVVA